MKHKKFAVGAGMALAAALAIVAPSVASAATLYRSLDVGSTGSDVTALQQYLALDASLYPSGRVTGYYGDLTKAAVIKFQARNGIDQVGRVGPVTMAALNAQMDGGVVGGPDVSAPSIWSLSATANNNSATVRWTTDENATGLVYYSTSPLMVSEDLHSVVINGSSASVDNSLRTSQGVTINNLAPNTTYYYMVHSADSAGNVSVSWPMTFMTQR